MNTNETFEQQAPTTPPAPLPPAPLPQLQPPVRRFSPGLAVVLSFFPGLGHLYLGLYQRGIAVFLAFAFAIWMGHHGDLGILIPFVWFFGLIDAYRQANALNLNGAEATDPTALATSTNLMKPRRTSLGFGVFLLVLGLIALYNQFYPIDFSFLETWWPLILVVAGAWLMARHFIEQKRRTDAERDREPGSETSIAP